MAPRAHYSRCFRSKASACACAIRCRAAAARARARSANSGWPNSSCRAAAQRSRGRVLSEVACTQARVGVRLGRKARAQRAAPITRQRLVLPHCHEGGARRRRRALPAVIFQVCEEQSRRTGRIGPARGNLDFDFIGRVSHEATRRAMKQSSHHSTSSNQEWKRAEDHQSGEG